MYFCATSTHFVHILDCLGLYIFFENGRFAQTKRSFFNEIAHSSKRRRCTKPCFLQCFLRVLSRGRFAPPGARAQERPTTHQQLADFDAPRPHIFINYYLLQVTGISCCKKTNKPRWTHLAALVSLPLDCCPAVLLFVFCSSSFLLRCRSLQCLCYCCCCC